MSEPDPQTTALTGWANTAPTTARVVRARQRSDLTASLDQSTPRGIIGRGLGRSYGDPAQNAGGTVIDTTGVAGLRELDVAAGLVTAEAGTSLDALMRWLVPLGWFVPVSPGTRQVTVGGAIAADIHGKNHHKAGSWCDAVTAITLLTPANGIQRVTPTDDPELFWATAGGMGLTGLIIDATFQLKPIETSRLVVDTDRTPDLDTTMALMEASDHLYDYSVAWIDLMAQGRQTGRSVLGRGRFASVDELSFGQARDPLAFRSTTVATAPKLVPPRLINPLTIGAFNEAWYRKAPRQGRDQIQSISAFFHPLDFVDRWNRLYGRAGFLQWQFVVPLAAVDQLRSIIASLASSRCPSFLAVLKRMGSSNPGYLSFPIEGWTLAFDVPARHDNGLDQLLDELDERVVTAGGRVYLAKDSRLRPELVPAMYPRIEQWRQVAAAADPDHRFVSDLDRRLHLR